MRGIELFAGAGGLLLGSSLAGVRHDAAIEWDRWACLTLQRNADADHPLTRGLRIIQGDARAIDWAREFSEEPDLLTGGPPCQPFSLGGVARGATDSRDMFPITSAAIAALRPRAFVIENVKGLTRQSFADYLELIKLRLEHPLVSARSNESWREHLIRLQREHSKGLNSDLRYEVSMTVVDAADYGIPQHRHRVFFVGFRSDVAAQWSFPEATHSGAALKLAQDSGEYWDRFAVPESSRKQLTVGRGDADLLPWRTVRDAISDLPRPGSRIVPDHEIRAGARSYPGHTGSPIDEPSKALKAGAHGVPGGENMLRHPNGRVRYYTVREAARIQTFPDTYALHGRWGEAMRQIGNAVPVRLAEIVISSVVTHLHEAQLRLRLAGVQETLLTKRSV